MMEASYKLISENGGLSQGSQVIDLVTGRVLGGVTSVDLHVTIDDLVKAEIKLLGFMANAEIGKAKFLMKDPFDGDAFREVVRVEYVDGTGFEMKEGRLVPLGWAVSSDRDQEWQDAKP